MSKLPKGSKLRDARESAGVSLREMSRRLGISAPYLSDLERGNRALSEEWVRRFFEELEEARAQVV